MTIPLCAKRPRRGATRAAVGVEVAREAMAWHPTAEAVARTCVIGLKALQRCNEINRKIRKEELIK